LPARVLDFRIAKVRFIKNRTFRTKRRGVEYMIITFLRGAILGFSMSIVFIGPSLFALIQTSIKNGFRSAAAMALGISLSDILLVFLAYLGAAQFLDNPKVKLYEGIGGSVLLFVFGIYELFQKHEDEREAKISEAIVAKVNQRLHWMLAKGFLLNIINPIVLFMWIVWMSNVSTHYNTREEILSFSAGTLGMIFILDLLKSFAANSLKKVLTHKIMLVIHYIMAIALIVCGLVLLYDVYPK
jgi:threonine/homoserine/homoserine lactone efflux protein